MSAPGTDPEALSGQRNRQKFPVASSVRHTAQMPITEKHKKVHRELFLSMDYGTKTLAMAYRIFTGDGDSPTVTGVHDIHFSGRDAHAPQEAAWDGAGSFHWGYDVEKQIKRKAIKRENVITLWKLLLYKSAATDAVSDRIDQQLGRRTLRDLLTQHIREVVVKAKQYIKDHQSHEYSAEEIDELPMKLFLSVPQMWNPPANYEMMRAAKDAGIEYVELVWEPQCAAAYYTHNMKDRIPAQLAPGDVMLIADIGGGTGDFVSYVIRVGSRIDAQVSLKTFKQPEGALCGSEWVNQNFINWVDANYDLNKIATSLALTRLACIAELSRKFEILKEDFAEAVATDLYITIVGAEGARSETVSIRLTSNDVESFFKPVINKIVACIESQRTDRTKVLFVPGGFGRSEYLLSKLEAKYDGILKIIGKSTDAAGAYQPISRGALLRYGNILPRGVPSNDSFGIGRVEEYDRARHPDATIWPGDKLSNGRVCRKPTRNDKMVEQDPYDEDVFVVYERWQPLVEQGEKLPGQPTAKAVWQHYLHPVNEKSITVSIYWTANNIVEGGSIRTGKDGMTPLKEGIEQYGNDLELDVSQQRLEKLGFKQIESYRKGMVYEVFFRLLVERDGANIRIKWEVAKPQHPPCLDSGEFDENAHVELTEDQVFEMCDANHNPFVRQSVN